MFKALDQLTTAGEEISVSSAARAVGVHRSLIDRHGDLHAAVIARAGRPPAQTTTGTQVSRKSVLADVANFTARNGRLSAHITRLERRLSGPLGQTAWEASGLGAPADVETLTRRTTELEQQILDLAEWDEDLEAARAADRELMAQLNRRPRHRRHPPSLQGGGADHQMRHVVRHHDQHVGHPQ
ncbi:hypothetical protein AB0N88_25880 [Streptomyces sp. NPDC093516]|uniref:hypothetical protein n=1 Tax=Streptomyces sp. NPDC093516 TaxID=3155304 RepID=UPI0034305824